MPRRRRNRSQSKPLNVFAATHTKSGNRIHSACPSGKMQFKTERDCLISIIDQYHVGDVKGAREPLRPYFCEHCSYWHKTSHATRNAPKLQKIVIRQARSVNSRAGFEWVTLTWNFKCPCCKLGQTDSTYAGCVKRVREHIKEKHS